MEMHDGDAYYSTEPDDSELAWINCFRPVGVDVGGREYYSWGFRGATAPAVSSSEPQ